MSRTSDMKKLIAVLVALALMLACDGGGYDPADDYENRNDEPVTEICIEDGVKVECPDRK